MKKFSVKKSIFILKRKGCGYEATKKIKTLNLEADNRIAAIEFLVFLAFVLVLSLFELIVSMPFDQFRFVILYLIVAIVVSNFFSCFHAYRKTKKVRNDLSIKLKEINK